MRRGGSNLAKPKVGIALGSGGARGMAHIGVLKVLQQEGIQVDMVAGSSIGSLIGVLYANGLDLDMVGLLATHLRRSKWLDFQYPRRGFIAGNKVKALIRLLTHGKKLEELDIPTAVVATDLVRGEQVVFRKGPVDTTVRASISIPGIFEPVEWQGRTLVDGGLIDRVPIQVLQEMGADFIIAVDVVPQRSQVRLNHIFDVIAQSLSVMEREILKEKLLTADVLIRPNLADVSPSAFTQVETCISRGEEATRLQLSRMKEMLGSRGGV
ncbi:patatin family protein [Kroppenstedtia pulmonis]|uniref:Patatin family protein n=1 Tax=Kroppenstedtia pulmonis TaxID=1380685 RepID=A0A7D3XJ82_9BACL|nr:patatin family protein [Kroppenstedtia pulmonis]